MVYEYREVYILRWNKPDYKAIIGIFNSQNDRDDFFQNHFEIEMMVGSDIVFEVARQYKPRNQKDW